jgi:caa(3)-type oxidase subunit IV
MDQPPETVKGPEPAGQAHGGGSRLRTYILIGIVLAVVTAIEIQIPIWLADDRPLMIVWLMVGACAKAALVMLYYMHLKFDSRVYSGIILLALVLLGYFLVLLVL